MFIPAVYGFALYGLSLSSLALSVNAVHEPAVKLRIILSADVVNIAYWT